jgi:hypothetical protein
MSTQAALQTRINQEMANFQKTMDELRLMQKVSKDLRSYKKLIPFKKFD